MKKFIFLLGLIVTTVACSSGDNNNSSDNKFDRNTLLTNWSDNIIIPSYENYLTKMISLQTATIAFINAPSEDKLIVVRSAWLEAYKAYQKVAIFNFGKAADISLNQISNTYPTDKAGIEANIISGTYNLNLQAQYDKQGFPGLDYLLNGLGANDAAIVSFYTTSANATNYKNYLTAVVVKLKANIDAIITDWKSGYRDTYVKNSGTSVTSAVSFTTNNFVKNLEKDIRTCKIGIPVGKYSNGIKYPEKVEALFKNDVSKELLNVAIKASKDFFNGKHFNSATTGASLKSYLDYVNAVRDEKKLSDIINTQYTTVFIVNDELGDSFSEQVTNDNSKMLNSFNALHQNVIYTKLDMMQALNITIDYVDSDGD